MRARILVPLGVLAVTLALAACGGSDGGDEVADTPQQTVTVTAPESKPDSKAKATKKKQAPPAADPESGKVGKAAPAGQSGGKSDNASAGGPGPGQVQATNDSPPEVTLAVIDAKSAYVKKTVVNRYAGLLDQLERSCREARTQLSEYALTASHDTAGRGNQLSILDVLKQVVAAHPSGVCEPAFTAVSQRAGG